MRGLGACGALLLCAVLAACGGGGDLAGDGDGGGGTSGGSSGGSSGSATNVVAVTVDAGPAGSVNTLFTTVTVCVPGSTTKCQTIDHVQVDSGSWGLRILASVLTLSLPGVSAPDGNQLEECTQFVDGYSWGSVALADMQIGGESASNLPIQIIGDGAYAVPAGCAGTGSAEDTVSAFGANGIIGIGVFKQDCGADCVTDSSAGFYYSCSTAGCNESTALLTEQVLNPIPLFASDVNGSFVILPSVASAGAVSLTGSLVFGIDTQNNNSSSGLTVLTIADGGQYAGDFTTVYNGNSLPASFIDTGSNGIYFDDQSIPLCTSTDTQFYCPTSTLSLSANMIGLNNVTVGVNFSIGNAQNISNDNPSFAVLPLLAGAYSSAANPGDVSDVAVSFDWGLPFFYGRTVAIGIEGYTTSAGVGPYIAF